MMNKMIFALLAVAFVMSSACADKPDEQLPGLILGKTGELLEIRLEQPVKEGTLFEVRPLLSEPPVAEARVVSCTKEWPFVALAKVSEADYRQVIPIGAKAYADLSSVHVPYAPPPMYEGKSSSDPMRFSIQFGTFYPRLPKTRINYSDYWQEYRLNYSFLKAHNFEATLSTGYLKGKGDSPAVDGGLVTKSKEVVPLTLLGRFRTAKVGNTCLVLGAGGGVYGMRTRRIMDDVMTSDSTYTYGYEFTAGLESRHGWLLELRYRDVPETEIQGFSLGLGARF
ncbi:MAG TPA: hypothetical protein PKV43_02980 [Armatimonadota bacterium]|jgi:hypothetical protein|nr:hypothetical protein [Armatimonadota bacterium]